MVIGVAIQALKFGQTTRVEVCVAECDWLEGEAGAASGTSLFRPRHPLGV
jgi:hypothetical protein